MPGAIECQIIFCGPDSKLRIVFDFCLSYVIGCPAL